MDNTQFKTGPAFQPYAIRDGHLFTGQQQNSAELVAEMMIDYLDKKSR